MSCRLQYWNVRMSQMLVEDILARRHARPRKLCCTGVSWSENADLSAAGEFLALRAARLLAELPSADEDAALLARSASPDLALSLGMRQRKRRLLAAAAQAGW